MSGEYDRADNYALLEVECDNLRTKNARLQEVNADLLEACEAFDRWADGWCPESQCCATSCREIQDQARAAIARAKGKSS